KNEEQLKEFESIVAALIKDKNINKALEAVQEIYAVKRKRISLDKTSIKEVQKKHSGTVELLNEYLQDEENAHVVNNDIEQLDNGNIQFKISDTEESITSIYRNDLNLTSIQSEFLDVFSKNNFMMPQNDLEEL